MIRLKLEELEANLPPGEFLAKPNRPRALILVPSRELLMQINAVAKKLSCVLKLRVRALSGEQLAVSQKVTLKKGMDLLITTPGRLVDHREHSKFLYY